MTLTELTDRLRDLDPAVFADANKQIRVLNSNIRPLQSGLQMVGEAYTVRCHEDIFAIVAALDEAKPGSVLVIDTQDSQTAVVGELFSTEAARKGISGIVIDGPCRDVSTIKTLPIPVYASSITPLAGTANLLGERQIPIVCGGVKVQPGDIVFGDEDGIIVAGATELAELLPIAQEIKRAEQKLLKKMSSGTSLLSLLNYTEHRTEIEAGNTSSSLKFLI